MSRTVATARVVFIKGVNVGGHRTVRPSLLAQQLRRFDVVNVGAAGTFVVRKPVSRARLRAAVMHKLPFEADVMICSGRDILRLTTPDRFAGQPSGASFVRFVSILAKRRQPPPPVPVSVPSDADWCVRVLAYQDRFVFGVYRRQMRAIGCLGQLEQMFGARMATRNWNTILAIARILQA